MTEPVDMLADFPGWVTGFEPTFRREQSRAAGGVTYVKDLGPALWTLTAQSRVMTPNQLDHWRARLGALEGGMTRFRGYSMSRRYPIAYPHRTWPTLSQFNGVAELYAVAPSRKAIRISGLPAGFRFSVGDLIQIGNTDLHRVIETSHAAQDGVTPAFEIYPHVWPGIEAAQQVAVNVLQPSCVMMLEPGSVSSEAAMSGWGSVSFRAIEAR